MALKNCVVCGLEFDTRDRSNIARTCSDVCSQTNRTIKQSEYREANPDKVAQWKRAYRDANRDKVAESGRAYREANPEKLAERQRAYRKANPEKIAKWSRAYYEANPTRSIDERTKKARMFNLVHLDWVADQLIQMGEMK